MGKQNVQAKEVYCGLLFHQNINNMKNNLEEFKIFVNQLKVQVIENWLIQS